MIAPNLYSGSYETTLNSKPSKTPIIMATLTDQYDFSIKSPSSKLGFDSFKHKKNDLFYFLFNNEEGIPFLFSQAYDKEKNRDTGLRSVNKNRKLEKRFHISKNKITGKYFFILKAGNHAEIARSIDYDVLKDLEDDINLLKSYDSSKARSKKKIIEISKATPSVSSKATETKNLESAMPRFSFRITLYPPEQKTGILKGKIEHLFSKQSQDFEGIDTTVITNFMVPHLGEFAEALMIKEKPSNQNPIQKQKTVSEIPKIPITFHKKKQEPSSKSIHPILKPQPVTKQLRNTLPKSKIIKLEVLIPSNIMLQQQWNYQATITAQSLRNANKVVLRKIFNRVNQLKKIIIPVDISKLHLGSHHVITDVVFTPPNKGNHVVGFFSKTQIIKVP